MSTAISLTANRSFYERLVLGRLARMEKGTLHLVLPDGEQLTLGSGDGGVTAEIHIRNHSFFKRCVLYGDIGFGEAYTDGDWDTGNITRVIEWVLLNLENTPGLSGSRTNSVAVNMLKALNRVYHLRRKNNLNGARKNISAHYDLNNEFFALFLDPSMTYSSAYFTDENMSLEEAQFSKYDRLCKQLRLRPSDHVLEIGSGWGANAIYMAKNYGCRVTTVTISEEQHKFAEQRVREADLSDRVKVILSDYRHLEGKFDKIVSVEMLEAVGYRYFNDYFSKCNSLLKEKGILALQVITCPDPRFESLRKGVDWIQKHIFPGSLLPSVGAINRAVNQNTDLSLVDLKDIGLDYARTLSIWQSEFNRKLAEVKKLGFNEAFIRKWNYYFSYCEAAFKMRNINVMQMVYVRPNNTLR